MAIYIYEQFSLMWLYCLLCVGLFALTLFLVWGILSGKIKKSKTQLIVAISSIIITGLTCCSFLPMVIQLNSAKQSLKKGTCETIEGQAVLHSFEEDWYRDDFCGYNIDFSVGEICFEGIEQSFPQDVLDVVRNCETIKVYYYNRKGETIILKIEK